MRALSKLIFLVLTSFSWFCCALEARGLTTSDYLELSAEDKNKLIQKYVKVDRTGSSKVNLRFYELFSDCDGETTIETAVKMDEFYEKFSKIFKGKFKFSNKPQLYLSPTKGAYARKISEYTRGYVDAGWSAGMFISIGAKGALFADFSVGKEVQETLFHEGTHQLMHSYTGGAETPVWLEEGIATNFESWDIQRSAIQNLNRTVFDSTRRHSLFELFDDQADLPLDYLLNMSNESWANSNQPGPNYAMAWLMVNTLLMDDQGKKLINTWMAGFRKGTVMSKMMSSKTRAAFKEMVHRHYRTFILPLHRWCLPAMERGLEYDKFIAGLDEMTGGEKKEHPIISYYRVVMNPETTPKEKLSKLNKLERESVHHPHLFSTMANLYMEAKDKIRATRYRNLAQREDPHDRSLDNLIP